MIKWNLSLRSRRLEVVGERQNGRARETREGWGSSLSPRVSPSRAPVFSCAHYFQAPATQAKEIFATFVKFKVRDFAKILYFESFLLAFLSTTIYISLAMLFNMSLN